MLNFVSPHLHEDQWQVRARTCALATSYKQIDQTAVSCSPIVTYQIGFHKIAKEVPQLFSGKKVRWKQVFLSQIATAY